MRRLFVGIIHLTSAIHMAGAEGVGSEGKGPTLRRVAGEGEEVVAPWFLRSEY